MMQAIAASTALTPDSVPSLELLAARKSFGAVAALRDARLHMLPGEVHALLGENGAGKSTIVKILAGVHAPDAGVLKVDGRAVSFKTPADARRAGIAVIYQEPTLFAALSITENIYMGRQLVDRFGRLQHRAMSAEVEKLLQRMGVSLDPSRIVQGLSIADQQVVEIAKALSQQAHILIMDEPTAALSKLEVDRLFVIVRRLREQGVALLFITHRLEEVFALTQRLTIMRDGAFVMTGLTAQMNAEAIVRHMVGRDLGNYYPRPDTAPGAVALKVRGLSRRGVFNDISFDVCKGEIVALAGLVGAGRSEVARAIFGIDAADAGAVWINGLPLKLGHPGAAVDAGLALVPEDRRQQGLVMTASIARNATLTMIGRLSRCGFMRTADEIQTSAEWGKKLKLKAHDHGANVATLSGGNQQKVVLAKWLATGPSVLIIDEPTRGIDVGAKAEVYHTIAQLLEQGLAVLMISSELPEVLGMAHRVIVLNEGRIAAQLSREQMSEETIMAAALGQQESVA